MTTRTFDNLDFFEPELETMPRVEIRRLQERRLLELIPKVYERSGLIRQVYPDLKIQHVHHAGNSSGVVDGAGAVLMASPDYARKHGMKPRARIVAMANMGDSPELMLNAPVPAALKVLAKAGL